MIQLGKPFQSRSSSHASIKIRNLANSRSRNIVQMRLLFLSLCLLLSSIQSLNLPRGAYIHIPFCRRRCFYCNFPVVVVGERKSTQEEQGLTYTALLLREMRSTFEKTEESLGELETVYFGGGTPSLLPVQCKSSIYA